MQYKNMTANRHLHYTVFTFDKFMIVITNFGDLVILVNDVLYIIDLYTR